MNPFIALAFNGFREARRNRITVVVGIFALILLLCSTLVLSVTVTTFERVLTDMGLGAMSFTLALLAIFLSSGLLSREIERRTIFLMVSKPISRGAFLVGRLVGNMLTLTVLLVAMSVLFFLLMAGYGYPVNASHFTAVVMLWFELWVLSGVGFLMSSFSSQAVSAFVTVGIYFAGHLAGDIYKLAQKSESGLVQKVGRAAYYLLPDLERLNYRPHATYNVISPLSELLPSAGYALAFTGVLVALAVLLFNRRDFR